MSEMSEMSLSRWSLSTLRRVITDLSTYPDERRIPSDILDAFVMSLELVHRELLALDCTYGLTDTEVTGSVLARRSLEQLKKLQEEADLSVAVDTPPLVVTGARGRPRYDIHHQQLSYLVENGFTGPQMAEIVGVSLSTVHRRMSDYGITVGSRYAALTNTELTTLVREIQLEFPNCGNRQMQGHLLARGYRVQQERVREAQRTIDPEGSMMRRLRLTNRREYHVAAPRSLWHMDGNHKLIR